MANTNKKKGPGTKPEGPIILPADEQEVSLPGGPIILPARKQRKQQASSIILPARKQQASPIILPLQQIHQMIIDGSITLKACSQNKLAAKKLKGLTQELSILGFNIDIKGDK